ncbi:permease [Rhizobium rosettiformans]|uniref:Permease n=1 Tax=Rhizobium rosettiformans TaxID=1368430 RepID=A0ABX7EW75_9HYPH|nr:permease [Rhizobium rosettiformans]QRF52374.1 permease [Rhizobium rosettiformans]
MDFMRLLKSLEELLYEILSWLVFYPLTFWRAVTQPLSMMRYADDELEDRPEDQYDDTISPPLFLLITLLLSQALSTAFPSVATSADALALTHSFSNLLIVRGVVFGMFPMVMAVTLILHKGQILTRSTLRPPFFSQCYVAAPFVFLVGLSVDCLLIPADRGLPYAAAIFLGAVVWYGQAEIRWFQRDLGVGGIRATGMFLLAFSVAVTAALALAVGVALLLPRWTAPG